MKQLLFTELDQSLFQIKHLSLVDKRFLHYYNEYLRYGKHKKAIFFSNFPDYNAEMIYGDMPIS